MKPEPYFPPLPRPLADDEALFLRVAASGPFRLHGPSQFATARRLAKLGLGELVGNMFEANEAGLAAVEGSIRPA